MPVHIEFWGALLLGILLGWFVYYINRYRTGGLQFSDVTTLVSVVGTASATLFAFKAGEPNYLLFAGFCIGLFVGYFGYLLFLVCLVLGSKNFTFDWFLDGRRKQPEPPFYIPDGTAVTVRPAFAPAGTLPTLRLAPPTESFTPHARSFRPPPPAAQRISDVDPSRTVQLTVVLKPKVPVVPAAYSLGRGLSREHYQAKHGTDQSVLDNVAKFAHRHGLTVVSADPATHTVKLAGTYAQAEAAFRPDNLGVYSDPSGARYVARSGHIWLPTELENDVVAVMGFDQRPVARPHHKLRPAGIAAAASYDPMQIAQKYGFPTGVTGAAQTIALIELGGGFDSADVAAYFQQKNVTRTGRLDPISVDGAPYAPNQDPDADGEVQLDIDVAGSVAPGANLRVYFGPNAGNGFYDAIQAALKDTQLAPTVISISWGGPESTWAAQDMDAMDQLFAAAAGRNITVCVASGDNGSVDNSPDGLNTTDFPASSPNVLGCGGTTLEPAPGAEVAWGNNNGASGGGYSTHFKKPGYQTSGQSALRGVPDVAGDADPATGYNVRVNGQPQVIGGTSAVAPLWAALVALANQQLSKQVGFINPALYANPGALNDITSGTNGGYNAGSGWDPVTGLGSPRGLAVVQALT